MMETIGQFNVTCGRVYICDPFCGIENPVPGVENGKWMAQVDVGEIDPFPGQRVKKLLVLNEHVPGPESLEWSQGPFVAVDAGTAGVFSGSAVEEDDRYYGDENCQGWGDHGGITPNKDGVFCSTGIGDGAYDCLIGRNTDGVVVGFEISFC